MVSPTSNLIRWCWSCVDVRFVRFTACEDVHREGGPWGRIFFSKTRVVRIEYSTHFQVDTVWCSVFKLLHDLAEVSPKCTEDRCYVQYGIANVQFLSIGDDMNWDDRWWHVHTQSMLGESCLHGCPVSFFCFCWVLRLRAFAWSGRSLSKMHRR